MKPKEVAARLNENERKLLHALSGGETVTTDKLSKLTGLGRDAVEKASDWAMTKGVVEFSEEVSRFTALTEEGETYSNDGLPEQNLKRELADGGKPIADLKKSFENLNIALAWIRRNGWANIDKGVISLTDEGKEVKGTSQEAALIAIKEGEPVDEDVLDQLVKRKLATITESTTRYVRITRFGTQVLPELSELETVNIITQLSPELLSTGGWKGSRFQEYDVSLPVPNTLPGKRHFISQVIDYIRRFWVELGFKEMKGEYLELNFWNFDALYQPQDHPARDLADTFYMKTPYKGRLPDAKMVEQVKQTHENGWTTGSKGWQYKWDPELSKRTVLRTHTTSLSVNQIAKLKKEDLPAKFFSVGRVFRNETIDWNHLAEFYQTDGIVIGEDVTFRDMKGYLKAYLEGLGLTKFRFRPAYFPYTEMSMEAEVWIEERNSWMELFGAGMFRPEVVKPLLGIDVPVLAWGPGFDRLVMQSYKVNTIKELYSNDIGLLRRAKLWTR
ncbi:phenylalanine--tRNA ligase subunit alpha [Candidatus Bathyarchaeota archaeon]|jgi:phenylalanyl-tRNA synthetase alpha chain|nr:phenylalanine--tRNA ligase subunit alpha [Candidatus Bathyarchaeota archaeon]MBT4320150.1 phenylalanine--tRNA ligase subunit alpha [Candidatus Bathyarchaeota archaeon]MBT4424796.1 phenylalanine--tRNA ligase subunit alpha [Candidatus Bathyarchaeota archaeon]MBT5643050.1 phenylalanine--tRNA ligase subunit alpha [Candidatus Bathyarchaeota archaeon]MBT6603910.1 phenylalanine--tRNA ligase subunit alpha [Candidatus Bathyarchaeota archaeon]